MEETNAHFSFDNGLELNGTITMTSRSSIGFIGNETLSGSGSIIFDTASTSLKDIEAVEGYHPHDRQ